jgi:hypothetical protein
MTARRVKEAEDITKNLPCRSISEQKESQVRIAGITRGTSISCGIGAPAAAYPASCVGNNAAGTYGFLLDAAGALRAGAADTVAGRTGADDVAGRAGADAVTGRGGAAEAAR